MPITSPVHQQPKDASPLGVSMATGFGRQSPSSGMGGSRGGGGGSRELAGSITAKSKGSGTSAGAAGIGAADAKDSGAYVIARHVADFGNVVVGFTKTKAFRVANTGKVYEERGCITLWKPCRSDKVRPLTLHPYQPRTKKCFVLTGHAAEGEQRGVFTFHVVAAKAT